MTENDFEAWLTKQNQSSENHSLKYKIDVQKTAPRMKNKRPAKTIIMPLSIENNATIARTAVVLERFGQENSMHAFKSNFTLR